MFRTRNRYTVIRFYVLRFKLEQLLTYILELIKQLEIKKNDVKKVLEQLTRQLLHENKLVKSSATLEERIKANNGIVCELSDIRHPPLDTVNQGYRNKCEFTIGMFHYSIVIVLSYILHSAYWKQV